MLNPISSKILIKSVGNMHAQSDSKFLSCLRELVELAEKLNDALVDKKETFDDNDMRNEHAFVAHFHQRTLRYAESIVVLTNRGFLLESVVIARVLLEGMFVFVGYLRDRSLAHDWHLFSVHEDYHKARRRAGPSSANKLMDGYKNKFGAVIEEAEQAFSASRKNKLVRFDASKRWYLENNLRTLVEKQADADLMEFYDVLYRDFSEPMHWTITGVLYGDSYINLGLAVAFDTLFIVSKVADERYELGFGARLTDLYEKSKKVSGSLFKAPTS